MKSNYKPIGKHIRLVDERNKGLQVQQLLGLSISKQFIPSVANILGTDMENYKIIRKNQFACTLLKLIAKSNTPVSRRIQFIIFNSSKIDDNNLIELVASLGGEYPRLFRSMNRPDFELTDSNNELFKLLLSKDFKLKVHANFFKK
jgi:hypothetical protein